MTNLKTIATTCLAISGLAMAQEGTIPSGSFPTPTSSSSSSVAAPRTGLYTSVTEGNAAADNTVDDYSRRPTLIGDRQYVAGYGAADLVNAAYSFRLGSLNWFGSVAAGAAPVPATVRFGVASGTSWGGGVLVAVDRTFTKGGTPSTETTTYYETSGFGVFGDFNLGSSDVYGQIGWNTGIPSAAGSQNSVLTKAPAPAPEDDDNNHTLSIMGGWKKDASTEGTSAINVEANYATELVSLQNPTVDATNIFFNVLPAYAYILKMNSDYSVFLGVNGNVNYSQLEQGSSHSLAASPNIAYQKQLGKGFEAFSGVSVTGSWFSSSDIGVDGTEASALMTGSADVDVGLRWVKDNFAFEGSITEALLKNGPQVVSGAATAGGMFIEVGMSLGI